jgi:hypothetical protein
LLASFVAVTDSCYKTHIGNTYQQAGGLRVPTARVDSTILHEIVRVIQARANVPERVRIQKREYQITYLDDHRQRIEEALRRHDPDRLSMLFGQLASKVKYQLLHQIAPRETSRAQARVARRRPSGRSERKRARSR